MILAKAGAATALASAANEVGSTSTLKDRLLRPLHPPPAEVPPVLLVVVFILIIIFAIDIDIVFLLALAAKLAAGAEQPPESVAGVSGRGQSQGDGCDPRCPGES